MSRQSPIITLIGGGTGSFTLLQELKKLTPHISALVNMSDDGGSTGVLRDELGVLPPGDIRQCLVALSDSPEVRDMFDFRFQDGRFENQSLGNIMLSGLELQYGSFAKAVQVASSILHITGRVIPITLDNHILVMKDGEEIVKGEYTIGHRRIHNPDATIYLEPTSLINPDASHAIKDAELLVLAPGNLYGSLLPALAVEGVREAFADTNAIKIVVANLVTKPGQTDNWHVVDYVKMIEKYIGEDMVDYVLFNNVPPSEELLARYASDGEFPVAYSSERFSEIKAKPLPSSLVAAQIATQDPHDTIIKRTLIRHDAKQVGQELLAIWSENVDHDTE